MDCGGRKREIKKKPTSESKGAERRQERGGDKSRRQRREQRNKKTVIDVNKDGSNQHPITISSRDTQARRVFTSCRHGQSSLSS